LLKVARMGESDSGMRLQNWKALKVLWVKDGKAGVQVMEPAAYVGAVAMLSAAYMPTPDECRAMMREILKIGLTRTVLAGLVGVSQPAISRWLDGNRVPSQVVRRSIWWLYVALRGTGPQSLRDVITWTGAPRENDSRAPVA